MLIWEILYRYWREVAIMVLVFVSWSLYQGKELAQSEQSQYKFALDFQNSAILSNKADYERKLAELPKVIEKIKVRYKVIYEELDNWKGDENATDCQNADSYLRSIPY